MSDDENVLDVLLCLIKYYDRKREEASCPVTRVRSNFAPLLKTHLTAATRRG